MLALFTVGVLARRAITRALEMHIALASFSSVAKQKFLSVPGEIHDQIHFGLPGRRSLGGGARSAKCGLIWVQCWALFFSCSPNDCADGNFHDLIGACASRHFL